MSLLLSLALTAHAMASTPHDTVPVPQASCQGPYVITTPYTTDSLNAKGKTFDVLDLLKQNERMVLPSAVRTGLPTTVCRRDERLTVAADSLPALRVLRFSVQTPRFVKANLKVQGLAHHRVFVDGRECTDGKLNLAPGRVEVTLQALTTKTDCDSLHVDLVGENLSGVLVNPEGKRPYTMADMLQGNHYYRVSLSPTGKYLLTVSYNRKADGGVQYSTTLSELATGHQLMKRNEYVSWSWLPGARDVLYYTRSAANGRELVAYTPADGAEKVLADQMPDGSFTVSPTDDYLIFTITEEGKPSKKGLKLMNEPDDRMPGWRNRVALWHYDLRTGLMRRLTYGHSNVWLNDISHDGRQLLLQYSRFDASRAPFDRTTFVSMDVASGKVDTLLCDTAFVSSARFSPNAKQLLLTASPLSFGGIGSEVKPGQVPNAFDYRLYLYDMAARSVKPLLPCFAPSVGSTMWSKADGMIYFRAADGCDERLFRLDPATGRVIRYELPVNVVSDYSIASAATRPQVVFFGQTGERAREMFTARLTNEVRPSARRIGPNDFDKLYADVAIGTVHDWSFKAERGDTVRGFYFLPPHFDASKKYPVIVYYYGGCTPTTKQLEFQYPLQVLAGQGYVVYVVEPSGAIGYGQEFAARHVNTWGHESGDDIIAGTKAFLAAHPWADAKRVGCMGASYGGFMTQYLQTQTDLFATAISHAGISNIASYWGGGYWGYTYGECAQYGSFPWNNPDLYVKQSPLFNADKIRTPLLLLHGTADTNVPTNESQQLFTALKILGRPVTYIQIEGEDHVISNYQKRLAWQDVIFAWFAKYLQDDATWWDALELQ